MDDTFYRYRSRIFGQGGHETRYSCIGNKHFYTTYSQVSNKQASSLNYFEEKFPDFSIKQPVFSRFLREVSPSSYLGQTQGLAGNSKFKY
jgi:hypothetical protein